MTKKVELLKLIDIEGQSNFFKFTPGSCYEIKSYDNGRPVIPTNGNHHVTLEKSTDDTCDFYFHTTIGTDTRPSEVIKAALRNGEQKHSATLRFKIVEPFTTDNILLVAAGYCGQTIIIEGSDSNKAYFNELHPLTLIEEKMSPGIYKVFIDWHDVNDDVDDTSTPVPQIQRYELLAPISHLQGLVAQL